MKKYIVLLLLVTSAFFYTARAQTTQQIPGTISVDATGEVSVPADLIHFNVQIVQFRESAREAFEAHKELESFLTNLLIEEDIDDENIRANPISINPRREAPMVQGREGRRGFETRQQVTIELDDISRFEEMQMILIENDFDNFSGSFGSSQIEEARDEALAKAVDEARRKADILAVAAGTEIGSMVSIEYGSSSNRPMPSYRMEMAYDSSGGSLLQFERTIPVQEQVHMVFMFGDFPGFD